MRGRSQRIAEERTSRDHRCEVVTPILQYDDLADLQEIVRRLREKGAIANSSAMICFPASGARATNR